MGDADRPAAPSRRPAAGLCRAAIVLAALLLLAAGPPPPKDGFVHALRLADGSVYGRRIFLSQKMLVGVASLNGEIARAVTLDISLRKVAADELGGSVIAASYDFLFYSEDGILGRYGYNSREGGPVPPAIRQLAPLVGRSVLIRTDPGGRIVAVDGADRASTEAILSVFPPDPVPSGGSWPWSLTVGGQGPMVLTTLSVKGLDERTATIGVRSVLKPDPGPPPATDDGVIALGLGLSGTQEGEFDIDRATGLPARGSLRQHFSGTINLTTGSRLRLPGGQLSVPMTGEGMLTLSSF